MGHIQQLLLYCPLCGNPIFGSGSGSYREYPEWFNEAILLRERHHNRPAAANNIIEIPGDNQGGPIFELTTSTQTSITGSPETVAVMDVNQYYHWTEAQGHIYIPLHAACATMVKQFAVSLRRRRHTRFTYADVRFRVWQVLKRRLDEQGSDGGLPRLILWCPSPGASNEWYTKHVNRCAQDWAPYFGDEKEELEFQCVESNPIAIPHLTSTLLSHLKPLPTVDTIPETTLSNFALLPPEILDQILSYLVPIVSSQQKCTYIMPPIYWRRYLLNGTLVPWLPRLDAGQVYAADGEEEWEWDWERLVRALNAIEITDGAWAWEEHRRNLDLGFEDDGLVRSLWNRRRIWTLVQDIWDEGETCGVGVVVS